MSTDCPSRGFLRKEEKSFILTIESFNISLSILIMTTLLFLVIILHTIHLVQYRPCNEASMLKEQFLHLSVARSVRMMTEVLNQVSTH
jgi:hypothetical protein